MERIDGSTWRTDNGDEVRAQGLRVTVEFGERTKAELLCKVKAVREENDRLRDFIELLLSCPRDSDECKECRRLNDLCAVELEAGKLGIEVPHECE